MYAFLLRHENQLQNELDPFQHTNGKIVELIK